MMVAPMKEKELMDDYTVPQLKLLADDLGTEYGNSIVKSDLVKLILAEQKKKFKKQKSSKDSKKDIIDAKAEKAKQESKDKPPNDYESRPKEKLQDCPFWTSNPTPEIFNVWKKETDIWIKISKKQHHSEEALYLSLMRQLPLDVKEQIYAEVDVDDLTVKMIINILERDNAGIAAVSEDKLRREYRRIARKEGEKLDEFVKRYRTIRAKALGMSVIEPTSSDYGDFLEACQLTFEQHGAILRDMKKDTMIFTHIEKLNFVMNEVKTLEEMYAIRDNYEKKTKKVFWTDKGSSKGGGSGKKGKSGSKGKDGGNDGGKSWGEKAQKGSGKGKRGKKGQKATGKGAKGKSAGKGESGGAKGTCWQFEKSGTCQFGADCRFSHGAKEGEQPRGMKRELGQGGPGKRPKL